MPRYVVEGFITASVVATVEAENDAEAREKAIELAIPSVSTDWRQDLGDGHWHFNEFDDFKGEEALLAVELDREQEDEEE